MNNREIAEEIFNKMMEIAGYKERFKDIVEERDELYYEKFTWSKDKRDEWYDWGVKFIRKKMKLNKKPAENQMDWFDLCYGLKEI